MAHPVLDLRAVPPAADRDHCAVTSLPSVGRPGLRTDLAQVTVIAPSRNERDNVRPLTVALDAALGDRWSWEVVFADDSDDETPEAVTDLAADGYPARLAHRVEGERGHGLSGAVLHALERASHSTIVVMDADLQHPAAAVPALASVVSLGLADIAVGSRFCEGGTAGDGLDGPLRRLSSEVSRAGTRALLHRVRRVRDPLSGFFAFRRDLVDPEALQPDGYKILLEILSRAPWQSLVEVPIAFSPRRAGESKFDLAEIRTFFRHVQTLRGAQVGSGAAARSLSRTSAAAGRPLSSR